MSGEEKKEIPNVVLSPIRRTDSVVYVDGARYARGEDGELLPAPSSDFITASELLCIDFDDGGDSLLSVLVSDVDHSGDGSDSGNESKQDSKDNILDSPDIPSVWSVTDREFFRDIIVHEMGLIAPAFVDQWLCVVGECHMLRWLSLYDQYTYYTESELIRQIKSMYIEKLNLSD